MHSFRSYPSECSRPLPRICRHLTCVSAGYISKIAHRTHHVPVISILGGNSPIRRRRRPHRMMFYYIHRSRLVLPRSPIPPFDGGIVHQHTSFRDTLESLDAPIIAEKRSRCDFRVLHYEVAFASAYGVAYGGHRLDLFRATCFSVGGHADDVDDLVAIRSDCYVVWMLRKKHSVGEPPVVSTCWPVRTESGPCFTVAFFYNGLGQLRSSCEC